MPSTIEHSVRLVSPRKFKTFRRENDKFGPGIHVIFGIPEKGSVQVQSLRFSAAKFSMKSAEKWAKDHKMKPIALHPAIEESLILRIIRH